MKIQHYTKTEAAVWGVWDERVLVPKCDTATGGIVAVTTAASNTIRTTNRPSRVIVRTHTIVCCAEPIIAPLPHIARHIIETITIG